MSQAAPSQQLMRCPHCIITARSLAASERPAWEQSTAAPAAHRAPLLPRATPAQQPPPGRAQPDPLQHMDLIQKVSCTMYRWELCKIEWPPIWHGHSEPRTDVDCCASPFLIGSAFSLLGVPSQELLSLGIHLYCSADSPAWQQGASSCHSPSRWLRVLAFSCGHTHCGGDPCRFTVGISSSEGGFASNLEQAFKGLFPSSLFRFQESFPQCSMELSSHSPHALKWQCSVVPFSHSSSRNLLLLLLAIFISAL